ncbi:aconitate hydratase [Thermodesulfovibrio sp. 3462-1]|jgi:aconitate hydratase|uniref:Aconitate hydratase A n=1 Tax=Thermodesulfovibrio obliviosus TaxID=3118332 RepID=A0AAU8GYU6_9BACT
MGKNIVEKIMEAHLVSGDLKEGSLVSLRVDQVYTQDATGTMAWLEFEAIGLDRVRVPLAVSYVDHNMLQSNFMNADDHLFLRTAAARFGAYFSRPGNGICHQVHLERFAAPGLIALGTDSHTPTGGGMGMIAIGVGGLEAASVMAGMPFEFTMPKIVRINLFGKLRRPYVTAMDVILTLLKMLSVKGGVGKIFEYGGTGVKDLSVTERATITNMGAELGATTSIFPSDENTLRFLKAQGRRHQWIPLEADEDAEYSEIIELDLSEIEPMIAQPHSPDNVVPVRNIKGTKVHQVCIGSCTNSSYKMMKTVASILKGRTVHEDVTLFINPGSKQVYEMLAHNGDIETMIRAGARILESACGPCIGMGGAPGSGQVSVRSYNRNFKGRSGTKDALVYLASPVVCALTAIKGEIVDPFEAEIPLEEVNEPEVFSVNDNMLITPKKDRNIKIIKGPNIKEVPVKEPLEETIQAEVLLKLGDNITTDDILPAGSQVLPYRSNIPEISKFTFKNIDESFYSRAMEAKTKGGGIIVGGENYGQGSSREHAAIAPMYLGIKAVIAKSFARIHRANLINFGILPLLFSNPEDYESIEKGDILKIETQAIKNDQRYTVVNLTKNKSFDVYSNLNAKEKELILIGGLLPYVRNKVLS